jgi:DNA mismatch repair protein MutS2
MSGSGASVFVEPFPVLELNKELAQIQDEQLGEINRVLRELTELVGAESGVLKYALQQLIRLDLIFARGRFGKAFCCTIPEISEQSLIRLRNARHPLLENTLKIQGGKVVPLNLEMDESKKALVITGPNTGGKTVLLKTIGLLSLMAHCGLPLPSDEGTIIPRFFAIEADIGDQQSISESLSTFSSHIRNIRAILVNLRDSSLILLDELGTGTDPEEGAPLAVAILKELLRYKIKVAITSHHSQMKMFAFNHPECITAAMEFDKQMLQPTYRVHLDQTGSSHAFEIAEKLGLPAPVLQSARNLVSGDQRQLQEYQSNLQQRMSKLMEEQQAFESQKQDWVQKLREEEGQIERLRSKLDNQLKNLKEQNVDLIRTLNARVENLLAAIRDAGLQQELRKQYREHIEPAVAALQELTPVQQQIEEGDWKPGERVWTNLYRDFGELVQVKKGQAELIIRNKRFVVPVTTLERKKPLTETLPQGIHVRFEPKQVEAELNLIGQSVEEALSATDKYLDDAFLNQLPEVRLIHGHGTGKLRKALEEMLQTHPHVRSFHSENPHRGGTGVTVAQLRT